MTRKTLAIFGFIAVVTFAVTGCGPKPPEPDRDLQFTATLVIESGPEGEEVRYLVNFMHDKQRMEMVSPGSGVAIVRMDGGVMWSLMTDKNLFIELPIRPENNTPLTHEPDRVIDYEVLGEETIDGHPVVKEHMVIKNEGDNEKEFYRWFATDLRWPIKAVATDGSWKMHYEDIVPGPQDPMKFEIPGGYKMIMGRKPHAQAGRP